ncbi:MAG: hypothetical protein K2Q12_03915, partial [Rickettsiales bacterium]|nr:hypothetical protein [Rickettsiales bacterium]
GSGNDSLTGNAGDDSLAGGAGDDVFSTTLANLTANDTLSGDAGVDTLSITAGTVVMTIGSTFPNITGIERYTLNVSQAHDITVDENYFSSPGFSGTTLTVSTNSTVGVRFNGSAITSSSRAVSFTGGNGNDTLIGGNGNDSMSAGAGNDSLVGGAGNDRFTFAAGNITSTDTVSGGTGSDQIYISSGTFNVNPATLTNVSSVETFYFFNPAAHIITLTDAYYATGLNSTAVTVSTASSTGIRADASAVANATNRLSASGGSGNDIFLGGAGNDTFTPSTGNDSVNGGSGNDLISFSTATNFNSSDTIIGGSGNDSVSLTGGTTIFTLDTTTNTNIQGIENFVLNRNGAHNITLNNNYFSLAGLDTPVVNITSNSSSGLVYNASAVTNASYSVNVTSGSGNDTITGGSGNDTINSSSGADNVNAGAGDDVLLNSGSNVATTDTITGGSGMDIFRTNAGTLSFNSATFTNFSGIERFELNNAAGHTITLTDAYYTSAGFVGTTLTVTTTSTSNITINASALSAAYTINATGFSANDTLTGGAGDDTIIGGAGNDSLNGSAGRDSINGGTGNDSLRGGDGVDTLTGDSGTDNYFYNVVTESGIGIGNRDIITDFTSGDRIDLSAFAGTFTFRAGGNGSSNFTGTVAQVAWGTEAGNSIISVDTNGDNVTDFQIELQGSYSLTATDFTL